MAGALLAETNFRTQIEADIRPFRGLLLGLFFITTGTSIDMQVNVIKTCVINENGYFISFSPSLAASSLVQCVCAAYKLLNYWVLSSIAEQHFDCL